MNRHSVLKKHRHNFPNKGLYSQSYGFLTSQVWMWELDHKEGWLLKNWWFQTVVLEKTLESPLDSKEIKPVHTKWNQPWILVGRTDAKAEPPILWPPDAESAHWKTPWCWEGLKAKGEEGSQRWDSWMACGWMPWVGWIHTQRMWVWANSERQWRTGKPGVL